MSSSYVVRRLSVRLALYFAARAGLVLLRQSTRSPGRRLVCLNCGTTYETVTIQ